MQGMDMGCFAEQVWLSAPMELVLLNDEVHVWRASLETSPFRIQQLACTLSIDEQLRAERFRFERDRNRFIVGRGLLRTILGRYLSIEPHQVRFCYGTYGKPALEQSKSTNRLRFNMSRSHVLALYCIALDREVGVDIETIRSISQVDQIAAHFFSPGEYAVFRTLRSSSKSEAFIRCWTCKEAYLKASAAGFSRSPDQFDVSLALSEATRLLTIEENPQATYRWSLRIFEPDFGYTAALAVEGDHGRLVCWQWTD